nr:hypothetical protein [Roseisolibacter agri]
MRVDFRAVDFRAVDFFAVDFFAVERLVVDFRAVDFFAVDLRADDFLAVERFAVDFFAVPRFAVPRFAVDFFAVDFLAVDFLAVDFFAVDFFAPVRLRGTLAPSSRASDRPIAIACSRLVTRPPCPALPRFSVPDFRRRIALATRLPAAFPYRRPDARFVAIVPPACGEAYASSIRRRASARLCKPRARASPTRDFVARRA